MNRWIKRIESYSRPSLMAASVLLLVVIGVIDYTTRSDLSFLPLYLLPVMFGVWFAGRTFGLIMSVLCVSVWVLEELANGTPNSSPIILFCNAMIALTFYFAVAGILENLRKLQRDLEERVQKRTTALTNEMQERLRLEKELLEISEREQRRIGHDLHDSLCQHLTGTALAGQVLAGKLDEKVLPEAADARQVVNLIEEAIDLTRALARGMHPMELEGEGLVDSFRELAATIGERFNVACKLECKDAVIIQDPVNAIHFYRIAQEAITNAIKHGKAKEIILHLATGKQATTLAVSDDGGGLSEINRDRHGMGLRIMAYRATMMGATFSVERQIPRGTRVICTLPVVGAISSGTHASKDENPVSR